MRLMLLLFENMYLSAQIMYYFLGFFLCFGPIFGLVEQYEQERGKSQEELKEIEELNKAKEIIYRMKNGIGGVTVATHFPLGEKFIHRNKWIFTCNGAISEENGHCNGDPLESVTAFRPNTPTEFCFVKSFTSINDSLCVATHQVKMFVDNGTVKCESLNKPFMVYKTNVVAYLEFCEDISSEVHYIYYANQKDADHVKIPSDNVHVKCDNEILIENKSVKKHLGHTNKNKYTLVPNRPGVCSFTERDKDSFGLINYLKF